jgi:hypothetical protein
MLTTNLPIKQSGWLYLWVGVLVLLFWLDHNNRFDWFESANLAAWSNDKHPNSDRLELVRVTDLVLNAQGAAKIEELSQQYPNATIAIIGEHSDYLGGPLIQKTPPLIDSSPRRKTIFLNDKYASSLASVNLNDPVWWNSISKPTNMLWTASENYYHAFQPDLETVSPSLIWIADNKVYPSFITQVLMSRYSQFAIHDRYDDVFLSRSSTGLIKLAIGSRTFTLSETGQTFPKLGVPTSYSSKELNQIIDPTYGGVIVFDDLLVTNSSLISRTLLSVIHQQTLNTNWMTYSVKFGLLFLLLLGAYKMHRLSVRKQLLSATVAGLVLVLVQSFFISQSLWLPIHLIVVTVLMSWIVFEGYHLANNQYRCSNQYANRLLSESIPIFYQSQKIETVLPFLDQIAPQQELIKRVYDLAIDAEAHTNRILAQRLHQWILDKLPNYQPSLERIVGLNDSLEEADNLEQTLVIDSEGKQSARPSNSLLNITHFGRYEVLGILGKGAMGIVFQGVDPKINRHVAIKTLQLSDSLDDESINESKQRFFREAETAGNLSHANIVTIYDVGEQSLEASQHSLGYIAMDLLTGAPLSEFTKKDKLLPSSLVYQLMVQMADALDYAHRQKVIHRDIKPGNIIYDDDQNRGTLTDFGIAYMSDHSKTKTGTIMGSPYYMSPEQVLGIQVDGRSDIFSLGVTFYQLLSGELPFDGESIATVAFHITKTKHEPVRNWNKKLPTSASRITNKAMHKDPEKRYQSMLEFKQALINALKRDFKKAPLS